MINISDEKKEEFWNLILSHKELFPYLPSGRHVTVHYMKRHKDMLMRQPYLWEDVIVLHGGLDKTVEEISKDPDLFAHMVGNFWGDVMSILFRC